MNSSNAYAEVPWWVWVVFPVLWLYLATYVRNRVRGKSAQMLGPTRIDPESPFYLRVLADASALFIFVGSLFVAGALLARSHMPPL